MDYMREIEPIENTMQGNRERSSLKPIDKIGNLKRKNVHSTIRTETTVEPPTPSGYVRPCRRPSTTQYVRSGIGARPLNRGLRATEKIFSPLSPLRFQHFLAYI